MPWCMGRRRSPNPLFALISALFCAWALFALIGGAAPGATAATYYVSPTGNDANAGTSPARPWKTLAKVSSRWFSAGDNILFQADQTFAGTLSFGPHATGTPTRPVIVGSYGTGRAILQAGAGDGISVYNTAGIVIRNLIVQGGWSFANQDGNTGVGIQVFTDKKGAVKLDTMIIANCEVSGFRNGGIVLGGWPVDGSKSGFKHVRITGCAVHDNGQAGIVSYGYFDAKSTRYAHADIYVGHCTVYNNQGVAGNTNNSGSGQGIVLGDVQFGTVERCVAYGNGHSYATYQGGTVGIWTYDSDHVTLQYNESYNNISNLVDGDGFDLDGGATNCVMQYNYSHDNGGAGFLFAQYPGARPYRHNVVRYNVSQNDGRTVGYGSLHFWNGGSGITDCEVFNNTVYSSAATNGPQPSAVYITTPTTNVHLRNNVFIASGGAPLIDVVAGQEGLLFQENDYWPADGDSVLRWNGVDYTTLKDWRLATGQEMLLGREIGLSVDPLLMAAGQGPTIGNADNLSILTAYRLRKSSPLWNAGLALQELFAVSPGPVDFYGTPLSRRTFSIGACQTP
ncbi:MAG TPA: right-handed parallel beta-helix repeat-containing protein [Chthonomonadaceae bacterium]|nr:right-handed parallel beta-helix repeat-containing protein [Chthonomonadaceae bacterium]